MGRFAVSFVADIFPITSQAGNTGRRRRSGLLPRAGSNRSPRDAGCRTVQQCGQGHQEEKGAGNVTVYATTAERVHNTRHAHCGERDSPDDCSPPLLLTGAPAAPIAIAGSQYRMKTRRRLDRTSRDLQVLRSDSILLLRDQGYSKIWSTVQSQAKLRSNHRQTFPVLIGQGLPTNRHKLPVSVYCLSDRC